MKILFLLHSWPPESLGGTEIYARRLAREFARAHHVRVFCREGDTERPDYEFRTETDGNIEVTKVNYNFSDLGDFPGTYSNERMAGVFDKYLELVGVPDIAHVHHLGTLGHLLVDKLHQRQAPTAVTFHDFAFTCPRGQRIRDDYSICEKLSVEACVDCLKPQCKGPGFGTLTKVYRHMFHKSEGRRLMEDFQASGKSIANRAHALIAPSSHHARIMEADGFPASKIRVMPYGYDIASFASTHRDDIGLVRKFGYLGSLIPSKGVHILIDAYKRLLKDFRDLPVELHIHGPAPDYHGDQRYAKTLKEKSRGLPITFHGPYDPYEVAQVLAELDAVVVPSLWWESHGMVVREAKLAGLPVIASDHGALAEAIDDGVNGLLFRPGDIKHLRDKMHILATTPDLADAIAKGRMDILSIDEDAKAHIELYK